MNPTPITAVEGDSPMIETSVSALSTAASGAGK